MKNACVLVVDTDAMTRRALCSCFETDGFRVLEADKCNEARRVLTTDTPDLVALDVDPGQEEGLALGREIRRDFGAAIIVLSTQNDRAARIGALDEFADDYVVKPFDMREVLARSHAILRRAGARARLDAPPSNVRNGGQSLEVAGFTLDLQAYRVTVPSGKDVELTAMEFRLLEALLTNANRVLSRERLLELSGGNGSVAAYDRAVDMRIGRLREKLGQNEPGAPAFIKTVRGVGYTFAIASDPSGALTDSRGSRQ